LEAIVVYSLPVGTGHGGNDIAVGGVGVLIDIREVGAAGHTHEGDGEVPKLLGLIEEDGILAVKSVGQLRMAHILRHLGGMQQVHGGGGGHNGHGQDSGDEGGFLKMLDFHARTLLFLLLPSCLQEQLHRLFFKLLAELDAVKAGMVAVTVHNHPPSA